MKRSAVAVRKPPADEHVDVRASFAADAKGAAELFRRERARLVALGVVGSHGKRTRTRPARKVAVTTDTRRW